MSPDEAAALVRVVEYGWPQREMLPETAMLYLGALSDLEFGSAQQAVKNLLRVTEYRPTVAEIRRETARIGGLLPPSLEQALLEAQRWYRWREQVGFSNGSSTVSVRCDTHDVVVSVCRGLRVGPSDPTWGHLFRASYREAVERVERRVLAGNGLELEA